MTRKHWLLAFCLLTVLVVSLLDFSPPGNGDEHEKKGDGWALLGRRTWQQAPPPLPERPELGKADAPPEEALEDLVADWPVQPTHEDFRNLHRRFERGAVSILARHWRYATGEKKEGLRKAVLAFWPAPEVEEALGELSPNDVLGPLARKVNAIHEDWISGAGDHPLESREKARRWVAYHGFPERPSQELLYAVHRLAEWVGHEDVGGVSTLIGLILIEHLVERGSDAWLPYVSTFFDSPWALLEVELWSEEGGQVTSRSRSQSLYWEVIGGWQILPLCRRLTGLKLGRRRHIGKQFALLLTKELQNPHPHTLAGIHLVAECGPPEVVFPILSEKYLNDHRALDSLYGLLTLTREEKTDQEFWQSCAEEVVAGTLYPKLEDDAHPILKARSRRRWAPIYVAAGLVRSAHPEALKWVRSMALQAEGPVQSVGLGHFRELLGERVFTAEIVFDEKAGASDVKEAVALAVILSERILGSWELPVLGSILKQKAPFHKLGIPRWYELEEEGKRLLRAGLKRK